MSKETTGKALDIIRKEVSESHREVLAGFATLDEKGMVQFAPVTDRDGNERPVKKLSEMTVDPAKVQVMGNINVTIGPVRQPVALFLDKAGKVFATSNIKSGTGFTHRLPLFEQASDKQAWNSLLRVLPEYLQAIGAI